MTTTMNDDVLERIDAAVDMVRPEAKEFVTAIDLDRMKTTQDGYGRVMAMLSRLDGEMGALFLIAMVGEGYPLITADKLVGIMGWPSTVSVLLQREYLKA